ncbi:MAG TPA: alpha/beta hydrolase [Acidimicrobiia bacterium]|nr:alpha/beta hydrolase [Acidimicrobiia bacterium]
MRVLPEPRLEGSYRTASGRRLSFAEYGDPFGKPVFWFHGTPGGRRQIAPQTRVAAQRLGIRLIVLERPGIGDSTPHLYRRVIDWAGDVGTIADRLGIAEFACVGLSGGGPYVLACAARFPRRMVGGAVLGGVAPTKGLDAVAGGVVGLARRFAPVLEAGRGLIGRVAYIGVQALLPFRQQAFELYMAISPEGDRRVFRRPEMKAMFIDDLVRAARRQVHAPVLDLVLFTRHWGFELRDISVPIRFWHGDADNIVPLAHAYHMVGRVPDAELRVRHGESHLGALDATDEIFGALLELWPDRDDAVQVDDGTGSLASGRA